MRQYWVNEKNTACILSMVNFFFVITKKGKVIIDTGFEINLNWKEKKLQSKQFCLEKDMDCG